jgi:hypothetical protein
MNEFDWYVPVNQATERAKKIYSEFAQKRFGMKEKEWPEYLRCSLCIQHGNRTQYLSSTMLHISGKRKRKGKEIITWRHLCKSCASKYKPRHERTGGKDY